MDDIHKPRLIRLADGVWLLRGDIKSIVAHAADELLHNKPHVVVKTDVDAWSWSFTDMTAAIAFADRIAGLCNEAD